jgi:hypothetical protein
MQYTFIRLVDDNLPTFRFGILVQGEWMTFEEVFSGWAADGDFREAYHEFLRQDHREAVFWEHPKVQVSWLDDAYECALVDNDALARLRPNPGPFLQQIREARYTSVFDNLGGDARMIVPAGEGGVKPYAHLMAFVRSAAPEEWHDFWQKVGEEVLKTVNQRPVYLNTHGLGISWLHVRLDSRPKYYHFRGYR